MKTRDLCFSLVAAFITAAFLYPTLQTTNIYSSLPYPLILIFGVFPIVSIVGMYVASMLGRKMLILWQVAKFGQVGVLNTAIDFGVLNFLIGYTQVLFGVGIIPLNITSYFIALLNSYLWNKNWVFGGSKKNNFVTFVVVTLIGLAINTGVVYAITTFVPPVVVSSPELWANLAKVIATMFSLVWNFAGYKVIVFKKSPRKKLAV